MYPYYNQPRMQGQGFYNPNMPTPDWGAGFSQLFQNLMQVEMYKRKEAQAQEQERIKQEQWEKEYELEKQRADAYEKSITIILNDEGGEVGDGDNIGVVVGMLIGGILAIIVVCIVVLYLFMRKKDSGSEEIPQVQQPTYQPSLKPQQPPPPIQPQAQPPPPPPPYEKPLLESHQLQPQDQHEIRKEEALDILKKRLAKGEIDLETYEELKKEIE